MSNIDLDYIVSKRTLSNIETTLLEYKKNILKDLSPLIEVPFKELSEIFLEKNIQKKKYYGPDRSMIDDEKCMACVWHKTLGPVQCSRKKFKNEDQNIDSEFCKIHLTKQNYD